MVLSLQFTVFDIEFFAGSDYEEFQYDYDVACQRDYLAIKDGDGTVLMERGCGSTEDAVIVGGTILGSSLPGNVKSGSNLVNLFFTTDGANTGANSGWSVRWSAV